MDKAKRLKLIHMARDFELDEPEAVAILEREMKCADAEVRAAAASAVCDYYHVPALVVACMDLARKDGDECVKVRAIQSLGYILEDGAHFEAEGQGEDPEELDRATYDGVKDLLVRLARDEKTSAEIGCNAVEALGWLGGHAEVKAILEEFYARQDPCARASALIAAGRGVARDWEPRVLEHLKEKSGVLLIAALKAVASLALRKAGSRVQELCGHSDPVVRNAAILAVPAVLPSGRANRLLKSLRRHKDPDTRRMVRSASEILEEESLYRDAPEEVEDDPPAEPADEEESRPETARAAILADFAESAAFRLAPAEHRPWLSRLADCFFRFLVEHQGTDPEEFEPEDLQDFLLEFLPVNCDVPPESAAGAPEGLRLLVQFMVETRRFAEAEPFLEALHESTPDFLLSIGEPPRDVAAAGFPGVGAWGARVEAPFAAAGPVKAHARSVDDGKRAAAGAGGRPGAPARGTKCPCGSGKTYGQCCGARRKR